MRNFHHSPSFDTGFCSWNSEKRQILELELQKSADSGARADFGRESRYARRRFQKVTICSNLVLTRSNAGDNI